MKLGRLYPSRDKVNRNLEEKPEPFDFMINFYGIWGFTYDEKKYSKALQLWNTSKQNNNE